MFSRLMPRMFASIPLLFGVTLLSFLLMHTAQGDFLSSMQLNPQIDPATIEAARTKFGLNQPWYVQYFKWIAQISRGNFGYSFAYQRPVIEIIGSYVVNTLLLSVAALLLALIVAFPLGILCAVKRNSWIDRALHLVSSVGVSLPTLLLALFAILFAAKTGWFPIGGRERLDAAELGWFDRGRDLLYHLVLPALVLAVNPAIIYFRQTRNNLSSVLDDPFIMTARAKGLHPLRILLSHAMRNALNPLISLFGFSVANLLNGAFLVEIIMSWPGLGRLTYEALLSRDLYLVMGSLTLASLMLIGGNLLADFLMTWNDPRIKISSI
ncbi:MAG: ABC transporter permease [Acidobacteriia bacterium]|nr:ABC transporter permease [Terriglobia bacterium]